MSDTDVAHTTELCTRCAAHGSAGHVASFSACNSSCLLNRMNLWFLVWLLFFQGCVLKIIIMNCHMGVGVGHT